MGFERSVARCAAALALGAAAVLASAGAPTGPVLVSSAPEGGSTAAGGGVQGAVTPSGRFVAFVSRASAEGAAMPNGVLGVFERDMRTGTSVLVTPSIQGNGWTGDQGSFVPSLSANGRFVLFLSSSTDLLPGGTPPYLTVYLADRKAGSLTVVSKGNDGSTADLGAFLSGNALSADGRYAVFQSSATNLTPAGRGAGNPQVYLYDRLSDSVRLLSAASDGTPGDGGSVQASISPNGRFVAFLSRARNLVEPDVPGGPPATNGTSDQAFVFDVRKRTIALVSRGLYNTNPMQGCAHPVVTDNGRFVAYESTSDDIVEGDGNGVSDVFLVDRRAGTTTRISLGSNVEGNDHSTGPCISSDGKTVLFASDATNLVPGDGNEATDVFRWDAKSGALARVSVNGDGFEGNGGSTVLAGALSGNGRWLALTSEATNLIPLATADGNDAPDLFLVRTK